MTKVIFLLLIGIFMLSFVSAGYDFDNIKHFDKNVGKYGKYEIRNSILGVPFLETSKVLEIELKQNTETVCTDCEAIKEITIYDRERLVQDIRFYNLTTNGWKKNKIQDYSFYVEVDQEEKLVEDYETTCEDVSQGNGSVVKECSRELIGSHIEYESVWEEFDIKQKFAPGTYKVKLEGKKLIGETVDWQIKVAGHWTTEWAIWAGGGAIDFFNGTISYYRLDETTGPVIDANNSYNATNNGSTRGITGIIGDSFNFTRSAGNFANVSSNLGIDSYSFTYSAWVNLNTTGVEQTIMGLGSTTDDDIDYSVGINTANNLFILARDSVGTDITQSSTAPADGDWHHVVAVFNTATDRQIWFDGNNVLNQTTSVTYANTNIVLYIAASVGTGGATGNYFDGQIDEIGIFDRPLNITEIRSLYNSGSGLVFAEANIIQNSPADSASSSNSLQTFNCTATIESGADTIENMSLYTNESGTFELVNITTGLSGQSQTVTWNRTLADGSYLWGCNVNDSNSGIGFSSNRTLTIDSTAPSFSVVAPNGTINYALIGGNETLNFTATDTNLDTCWYDYNGTNITIPGCVTGVSNSTNFTLENNNFNITLYANDTSGNENSSFFNWSYTYLENNRTLNTTSYETASETFTINVEGPSAVTMFYNDTEYTMTKSGNDFTRNLQVPVDQLGNSTVVFRFDDTQNSTASYQNVSATNFTLCDFVSGLNATFLNVSFKDETNLSVLDASVPSSTFVYYLGDGTVTKTYTLINNTENTNYEFCATPNRTINVNSLIQYKSTGYPQRIYDQDGGAITNETTNLTLYLLSNADGIFVTFQVFSGQSLALEDVDVTATRQISGQDAVISQGTTDAAGSVTFWMNPDFLHTITFIKTGFETTIESIFPTQSLYTITMAGGTTTTGTTDLAKDITIVTQPVDTFIDANTIYTFNYTISSPTLTLDEYGFDFIYVNGTTISSQSDTTSSGGTLDISFNSSNNTKLIMNYYYITNSTRINGSTYWLIVQTNDYSIWNLFTRVTTYISADLFGILGDDDGYFSKAIISLLIIVIGTGVISSRYGIASEAAVTGIMFGIVFMLNLFNLIPTPDFISFINLGDLLVMIIALIAISTIVKEELR